MSITEGDISANFRFNNRTGLLVPETITDERQIVAPLPEFSGDYGFTLNETPQTDIAGIIQVMRVSDSQIFTHTNLATVGLTEYFFDYSNDMPTLFFNAANNGEEFAIQYFGVGGAVNGKNIDALVDAQMAAVIAPIEAQIAVIETNIELTTSILGKIKQANQKDKANTDFTLLGGVAQIRNLNVNSSTITIKSNSSNTFGILEIFGDINISDPYVLYLGRILLIVHGDITGNGTISGLPGANGGNGRSTGGGGGGGGNGNSVNIICFGTIADTLTIKSGIGGTGGAAAQVTNDAGSSALVDFGGAGGTVVAAANNGGGGGGGFGNGGNGANGATSATTGGEGAGGGGGSSTATTGASGGIVTGLNTIWMSGSTGGKGGNGGGSPQKGTDGATGNVFLYSRYTSAPCTVTTSYGTSDGATGIAVYNELAQMSYLWGLLNSSFSYSSKSGAAV